MENPRNYRNSKEMPPPKPQFPQAPRRFSRPFRGRWTIFILLLTMGCLDKYPITADLAPPTPPLVVEGFIDATQRTATVVLSRTVAVMADQSPPPEQNAIVKISDNTGDSFTLPEVSPGRYVIDVNPDFTREYTLHIQTSDGTTFTSDPVVIQRTPAIDSITWSASPAQDALNIMINAHDTHGNAKYFIWNFEETWQYHSAFNSELKWVDGKAVPRPPNESVSTCYKSNKSSNIILATNNHLSENIISGIVINQIPKGSQKTQERYSIIVTQRVLSHEEYRYQSELKRTTESVGGLFDSMTGYVAGNIHQDNDRQAFVIGFFSGGETVQKRVFIQFVDLPTPLKVSSQPFPCTAYRTCSLFIPPNSNSDVPCEPFEDLNNPGLISAIIDQKLNLPEFYVYSEERCTDCRLQGGVVQKPAFWPVKWN